MTANQNETMTYCENCFGIETGIETEIETEIEIELEQTCLF
jgi:hypothetical protein